MNHAALREAALAFVVHRTVRRVMPAAGLSVVTAQRICHAFRLAVAAEGCAQFDGPAEVDETYIGAQRKNQRLHIRKLYPPKRGHGTQKLPIIGALDRATGTVRVEVMARKLDKSLVLAFVERSVRPGARIFTDGFPYYRDLAKLGYLHEWVDHNAREYVRGDVHTNGIEGFWGFMKRRMGNTGGMRRARLGLFAAELAWRYNVRRKSDDEKADLLVGLVTDFGGRI
jgi:transposase-like protein